MRMILVNVLMVLMSVGIRAEKTAAQQQAASPPPSKFTMMTSAYADGDWIPAQYACGVAEGTSPGVQWSNPPDGTMSFALIFHDTDAAPGKGAMDVTHWLLWNIAANAAQIPASVKPDASPDGIQQGKNIRGVNGYQPPCPPVGARPHHYIFELFALDTKLDLPAGSGREDLLKAMGSHVIGKASVVGIFGRGIDPETWGREMTMPK